MPDLLGDVDRALAVGHPIGLLTMASAMLSVLEPTPEHPFGTEKRPEVPPIADLLDAFVDSGLPQTQALAWAMAELHDDDLLRARMVRSLRSATVPEWLTTLASTEVYGAHQMLDSLRDGANVALGVRLGNGDELVAISYIDFNLGTAIKDGFVADRSLAAYATLFDDLSEDSAGEGAELVLADAKARVSDAMATGEMTWPPMETESWPQARPLLRWLLRRMPDGGVGYDRPEWSEARQDALANRFSARRPVECSTTTPIEACCRHCCGTAPTTASATRCAGAVLPSRSCWLTGYRARSWLTRSIWVAFPRCSGRSSRSPTTRQGWTQA